MFSSRSFGFSSGVTPWFRVGTVDVGSMMILGASIVVSMIIRAFEGAAAPLTKWLAYDVSALEQGQVWRLITWFFPNQPSLWLILSALIIASLGGQLEAALGRRRTLFYIGYLLFIPSLTALLLSEIWEPTGFFLTPRPGSTLSSFIILAFVCYLPGVRFFFGIPGWVLVAIFAFITVLQLGTVRAMSDLVWYLAMLGFVMVLTKSFGLANDVAWIPNVPLPAALGGPGSYASGGSGKGLRNRRPSGPSLDDPSEQREIDAILDQVSAEGVQSLSRAQKRKLKAHSKKRKGRRP